MEEDKVEADIVILGHIAKDIIEIDGVKKHTVGGAVYYGGIAGSRLGLNILIITRLLKEDFDILEDFEKNGITCLATHATGTSGLRNIYSSENMEVRVCKPLDFAGMFKEEEIPEIDTKYFVLGPIIAGEIDIPLLEYIYERYPNQICIDIQGFVRIRDVENDKVYFCNMPEKEKEIILSKVTILKLDHAEAKALTGKEDIREAADDLISYGPKEILLSHKDGISLFTSDSSYFYPWKNRYIKGRTGRGDTAFISYVGSRISKEPEEALKFAIALTSLKLEAPGPFSLSLTEVEDLIKREYS